MNYHQSLEYIHSFKKIGPNVGLSQIKILLERLGNPQNSLKFVHVAGTNGKGSTVTICSDILTKAGYRCGKYTSPFIMDFRERFQVDNLMIDKKSLARLTTTIKSHIDELEAQKIVITEFVAITAIAFLYFKEQNCDIVMLEVGLGGRFDATNIIENPLVCAITSISLDHVNILGDSIEKIAFEKSGIIKDFSTVICYPDQHIDATAVIMQACAKKHANFILPSTSTLQISSSNELGTCFIFNDIPYNLSLSGKHQIYNAITSISICDVLKQKGFNIDTKHIQSAFSDVKFSARFEILSKEPLFIIDGAHNLGGITTLVDNIKNMSMSYRKLFVIMGMLSDKDYKQSVKLIAQICDSMVCVDVNMPRSLDCEELCLYCRGFCEASFQHNLSLAVENVVQSASPEDLILCCGSLYMVSDVRKIFYPE